MDSSFLSTCQRSLSVVLEDLIDCLTQNEICGDKWLNIRPRILNDLNTVLYEGQYKGKSALWYLARSPEGRQLLINDYDLLGKITDIGLNAVIASGLDKGTSPLCCLARSPEGQQLLKDDEVLRMKISAEGLNAIVAEGPRKGESALLCLAAKPVGRQLLIDDA